MFVRVNMNRPRPQSAEHRSARRRIAVAPEATGEGFSLVGRRRMGSQIDSIEKSVSPAKAAADPHRVAVDCRGIYSSGLPCHRSLASRTGSKQVRFTPKLPGLESQPPSLAERLLGRCDVWAEKISTAGWSSRSTTIFTLFFQIVKLGEVYRVVIEGE